MSEHVYVYRHCSDEVVERRAAVIARLLATSGPGEVLAPSFAALPGGGFRWRDGGRLRAGQAGRDLPATPEAAEAAAVAFFTDLNRRAAQYRRAQHLEATQLPDPFPATGLVKDGTRRVSTRPGGADDHWLTSWMLTLPVSPSVRAAPAVVLGGVVDVRVGVRGRVVGVCSRIRPWTDAVVRPRLEWAGDPEGRDEAPHHDDHADGRAHDETEPRLVYVLDPPHERQPLLAPFWKLPGHDGEDHHARHVWPASDLSLLVEIVIDESDGEATAYAAVAAAGQRMIAVEHGRDYRLRWAVADLPGFLVGERKVTTGTFALLPGPGLYQVALEVEHVASGAVRSTCQQVAIARRGEAASPPSARPA